GREPPGVCFLNRENEGERQRRARGHARSIYTGRKGVWTMRFRIFLVRATLVAVIASAYAASAAAQTGRVGGTVQDEAGNRIKGATVTAENPSASPSSFTAITDDKGRFSIIGMRSGVWTFTATMQGYAPEGGKLNVQTIGAPNPPITFTLKKGGGGGAG